MTMFQSRYAALALALGAVAQTSVPTSVPTSMPSAARTLLPVELGTAGSFAILAKAGVSTVPQSSIIGDIGVSPISDAALTGFSLTADSTDAFATSTQVVGHMFAANHAAPTPQYLTTAVGDMETAYTDAASRPTSGLGDRQNLGGSSGIGGMTLTAGVYAWTVDIKFAADIYISGSATDVFILQTTGNVIASAGVKVILEGGAKHENIFWQVAGFVEAGAGAHLEGVFLVKTRAAFVTGASLNGRVLAQTAVTLDAATIDARAAPLGRRLQAAPTVELGAAGSFAILAKTGVSTVPQSSVTGDVGVSPITGAAITGFSTVADSSGTFVTSTQVTGQMFAADFKSPTPQNLITAIGDMETAYTDAASRPTSGLGDRQNLGGSSGIGGMTLTAGVYAWTVDIKFAADIYISGSATDVFILQTTGNVIASAGVKVILEGGAKHENIFWQVAGFVEAGAGAHLEGVFLVKTRAAFVTGASLNGRVLAQTAVTLDAATIDARAAPLGRRLQAAPTVELGAAGSFAILAKTGVSTVPQSSVTGDVGVSPITGAAITGFSTVADSSGTFVTSTQVTGQMFAADFKSPTPQNLITAIGDMETAYTDAASRPTSGLGDRQNLGGSSGIGGMTLTAGVYAWTVNIEFAADIYISGSATDVFILQTTGNVIAAAGVKVILLDGAKHENIFWQVAGFVEAGAGAHLEGVFLVKTEAKFVTGASLNGRVLAQTAVTLQSAVIDARETSTGRRLQAAPTVELGAAGSFAILAKTGVSTVPQSSVTGDVGVSPITGAAITGFSTVADSSGTFVTSTQVTGQMFAADFKSPTPQNLITAIGDMETAYTDAASRPTSGLGDRQNLGGSSGIGGMTLTAGVYAWTVNIEFAADIYISGSATDVFILQTTGNVIAAAGVKVILLDGAKHENIFWQVAGFVEAGAGAHLEGVFLVKTEAKFVTGASLNGRVLAQTAVTLQSAVIDARTTKVARRLRGSK